MRALVRAAFWLRLLAVGSASLTAISASSLREWPAQRFVIFYLAPIVFAFFFWCSVRVRVGWESRRLIALDMAVVAVSAIRFFGLLPASGHMLFSVYSGLTTREWRYGLVALVLAAVTTYFKLMIWEDARSWWLGLLFGLVSAVAYHMLGGSRTRASSLTPGPTRTS